MDREGVRFLRSRRGEEALSEFDNGDWREEQILGILTRLRQRFSPSEASAVVETLRGRRAGSEKFQRAGQMLFTREGLEQATSEVVAAHRARRVATLAPGSVADLGCGIGGDAVALAQVAPVVAIDLDPVAVGLAAHNVALHKPSHGFGGVVGDVLVPPLHRVDVAFADPARREGGRRRLTAAAYRPPLHDLLTVWRERVASLAVKVAPGIDHDEIPAEAEAEFVSLSGGLRECCLWLGDLVGGPARRRASVLPQGAELTDTDPADTTVGRIGSYLHEPDPAVIRAHLVGQAAARLDAHLVDPTIAYLSSERRLYSPIARSYRVESVMPFHLKRLRAHLRGLGVGQVTVKKRGSPLSPEQVRAALDLRGSEHRVVVLTREMGRPVAVVGGEDLSDE